METLPDEIAIALVNWRRATLDRERKEALLYLQFKNGEGKKTVNEIEALVESDNDRYDLKLKEAVAEAEYGRLYEKLMGAKRLASLRTAY